MSEHLETKLKDKSKESDHFRLLCGTWRHKAEELETELQQKEEKLLQSEEENSQYRIRIAQLTLKLMDKEQEK